MGRTRIQEDGSGWNAFAKSYQAELKKPDQAHLLDTLAKLSRQTSFSIGCYCENERRCHRSILRRALIERGATVLPRLNSGG